MKYSNKIKEEVENYGGIITTAVAREKNIPTIYLTRLVREGKLKRIERGIYMTDSGMFDELYILQNRFPKIIYSFETALNLLNLTDKIPHKIEITVNHGYKFNDKPSHVNINYVGNEILNTGVTEKDTVLGNKVRLYSAERTLCDFIRKKSDG